MSDKEIQSIVMRAEDEYERMKDRIHDLYDENKELKKEIDELSKENLELRRKINKTVQYIQQKRQNFSGWLEISSTQVDELLDILEGVDKE